MQNKKNIVSVILTLASIAAIAFYLYKNQQIFSELTKINPLLIVVIMFFLACSLYINGVIFKVLMKPFNITVKEHFLLSLSTSFFNLITFFSGGMGVRAVYMKKKYNLSYASFISFLMGNYIVVFLISSLMGMLTFVAVYVLYGIFNYILMIIFAGIFIGSLAPVVFPNFRFKGENFFASNVNRVMDGWQLIIKHKYLIWKLVALNLTGLLFMTLANFFAFWGIGVKITLLKVLYITIVGTLTAFSLNITPGSIGVMETLYVISGKIVGTSYGMSLIAALIIRAASVAVLAGFGPIANYLLARKIMQKTTDTNCGG